MSAKKSYISKAAKAGAEQLDEQAQRINTEIAKGADIDYFWGWAKIAHDEEEHYPAPWEMIYDFVATHLTGEFDEGVEEKLISAKLKKEAGRHKVSTVRRRLSTLRKVHKNHGYMAESNPCSHPEVLKLLNDASKTDTHANRPPKAAVQSIVDAVIDSIPNDTVGIRDKAMFYVAFGAGGRRRSELVNLRFNDIVEMSSSYAIVAIRGAKNQTNADEVLHVKIAKKAKYYLDKWLEHTGLHTGYIFRQLTPHKHTLTEKPISGTQFYRVVKKRFIESGVDGAEHFTPHSFRSGFVTEQGKQNRNIYDGMAATGHKSRAQYEHYYQAGAAKNNEATDL